MSKIIALALLGFAVSACASYPSDPAIDAYPSARMRDDLARERAEDGVRNMQTEFDQLTGGAG